MDFCVQVGQAKHVALSARVLPLVVATLLMPCSSALAAGHPKPKPKPKPTPAAGHVGIGSAWGPVVVRPTHTGSR